ncbi:DUF3709 domain-containing protein [Vibrio paracholerae]|nr:DUF3709 domain-containing protein [Vibrio paracholerae]
MKRQCVCRCKF